MATPSMSSKSTSTSTSTDVVDVDADVKNVLQTLASIKVQISSVLGGLQRAQLSATAAGSSVVGDLSTMSTSQPKSQGKPTPKPTPKPEALELKEQGQEMSRDDVKAQREAAKAAKAARKKKGGGGEAAGDGVPVAATPTKPTTPKNNTPREKKAQPQKVEKGPSPTKKVEKPGAANDASSNMATPGPPTPPKDSTPTPATPGEGPASCETPETPKVPRPSSAESAVDKVHFVFGELGLKYANHIFRGSNSRTRALLKTTKSYVLNYHRTADGRSFKPDLSAQLQIQFEALKLYRPHAVGMTTAIEGVNEAIRHLPDETVPDDVCREELAFWMDTFIEEKITKAMEAIAQKGADKIGTGETILTFSLTEAVYETFKLASQQGKCFNVIIALTRPREETRSYLGDYDQLKASLGDGLKSDQINITCVNLSSIMSFVPRVDKVFLGGHALFTTGGVMAHAGASLVSLCAGRNNIPVIFFCETYKFCDKSPTDAFYSEIFPENKFGLSTRDWGGGGEKGGKTEHLPNEAKISFDVTPVDLVTCVITDIDMLPSSSVPVVLRVQENRPFLKCL